MTSQEGNYSGSCSGLGAKGHRRATIKIFKPLYPVVFCQGERYTEMDRVTVGGYDIEFGRAGMPDL